MTISARAEAASLVAKSRRLGLLTSGTAMAALIAAGAGLVSPISVRYAVADEECGEAAPVGAGLTQFVTCGNITDVNAGVTYNDDDIQDGSLFDITFTNSEVKTGGVRLDTTTNNNGFKITIQDGDGAGGVAAPSFKNDTGGDAALDVTTTGTGSGITVDLKAGSMDGNGGSRQGIQLTTGGTGSDVTVTTAAGTSSKGTTGIEIDTNGGSNITATVNGTATGTSNTGAGLSGDVDGGTGYAKMTVGAGGSVSGGLFGVEADTSGGGEARATVEATATATATKGLGVGASSTASNGGNAFTTVNGTATAVGTTLGVGSGTGSASTASDGGNATTVVGPQGISTGSLFGASATADDDGDAIVIIGSTDPGSAGKAEQTSKTAGTLPIIPAGAIATSEDGNASVTAHQGSTVTQIGSTAEVKFLGLPEVKGFGMLAISTGEGAATTTANGSVSATGIGAAAIALEGDATTNVGGNIKVGGGTGVSPLGVVGDLVGFDEFDLTVGAAAISGKNAATVNLNGGTVGSSTDALVTPDIGGLALVVTGTKNATIDGGSVDGDGNPLFNGSTVTGNKIGLIAVNLGSGNAVVDLSDKTKDGNKNIVNSGETGIIALAVGGGDGNVLVKNSVVNSTDTGIVAAGVNANVQAGDVNSKDGSAVLAFSVKDSNVDVYGAAKGDGGILTPVAGGFAGGTFNLNVKAGASLNSNSGSTSDVAVGIVALDKVNVVNDGTINGTMNILSVNGNHIVNNSNNSWNFSGIQVIATGGDNIIDNNGTATATNSLTFLGGGTANKLNNNAGGTFNANGLNAIVFVDGVTSEFNNAGDFNVNGVTGFFNLDEYNNSGTTNLQDGGLFDLVFTTGNFNGTDDSTLAIDAQLTPGGFADWLFVGGDVTGTTFVDVQDLDGGPGIYTGNEDAILFALVGGDTDSSNFTTNGGYDKGLFRYDVYLRETPIEPLNFLDWNEWVLASTLDREAFEFPVIQYGAQNLWYASTGTWLDRTADLRSAFTETTAAVDLKNEGAVASMPGSVTPGVWGRVFGGTSERDMENTAAAPEGLIGPENVFEDTFNQDYYGFMAGVDFGKEGVGANGQNTAWLFGIMGGYTGSNLDFDGSNTDVDYQQGSIGAYVTYLNGGFFADAAVKADFGNIDYSTQFGGDDSGDYTSIGVIVDTGYRYNGASGWFIEPKATLAYVNTDFDDLEVLGTGVEMSDGDSLRGRLGVRVGGTMMRDANLIEPYLEASLWNEFDGDYDAGIVSNGFNLPVNYDAGGLSGEVAAGANIINVGNGWNAFAKGAVQFGEDDLLGFSGNLGFRKNW